MQTTHKFYISSQATLLSSLLLSPMGYLTSHPRDLSNTSKPKCQKWGSSLWLSSPIYANEHKINLFSFRFSLPTNHPNLQKPRSPFRYLLSPSLPVYNPQASSVVYFTQNPQTQILLPTTCATLNSDNYHLHLKDFSSTLTILQIPIVPSHPISSTSPEWSFPKINLNLTPFLT